MPQNVTSIAPTIEAERHSCQFAIRRAGMHVPMQHDAACTAKRTPAIKSGGNVFVPQSARLSTSVNPNQQTAPKANIVRGANCVGVECAECAELAGVFSKTLRSMSLR